MDKIKSKLSITNISKGDDREVRIEICNYDYTKLFEASVSYNDFLSALFGLVHCDCVVNSNEVAASNFFKKRISKELIFEIPNDFIWNSDYAKEVAQSFCDEGFKADTYFGSQNSFFSKDGKRYARTTQVKYEKAQQ